ncbi:Zn-ribbon domain-containing OB-fold protein [Mycobacterium neumannii]|uniref:Zn-ribbon domain-containing OB-fold protein n=1 Tax=Mycobacterium neumannii TaxID=2048551 RepID=UPI000B9432C1|nr:Zn-ribbon domain-containing OB-fold protein [Mycobacterium neumannii]
MSDASVPSDFSHAPRILPPLDDTSRPYWTGGAEGRLLIAHCAACRRYVHPPRPVCPTCGTDPEFVAVSGRGTVFTYTVCHQQFNPSVPTPFVVALIELSEDAGTRLIANVVDCDPDAVYSGMPVELRFQQQDDVWVPVFAPVT